MVPEIRERRRPVLAGPLVAAAPFAHELLRRPEHVLEVVLGQQLAGRFLLEERCRLRVLEIGLPEQQLEACVQPPAIESGRVDLVGDLGAVAGRDLRRQSITRRALNAFKI